MKILLLILSLFLFSGCGTFKALSPIPWKEPPPIGNIAPPEPESVSMLVRFARWAPLLGIVGIALLVVGHKTGGVLVLLGAAVFPLIGAVADFLVAYVVLLTLCGVALGLVWGWYILRKRYSLVDYP